jgi:hypothetical protein
MKQLAFALIFALFIFQCRQKNETYITQFPGKPEVPSTILKEHADLLSQMQAFTSVMDSTGQIARKLYEVMQHHFQEEEDFVLPPLSVLPLLASGQFPERHEELLLLTEKLKTQLSHMNAEHQMIKVHVGELKQAAAHEGHSIPAAFEENLHRHAQMEEEIFFPAAILVGEYLKQKSNRKP